jgi:hypothetical protein
MNVGAVGAIGSGTASVYAILSPYLNGVVRTSNAAAAAELQASAAATSAAATQAAIAARGTAAAALTAAPPFDNPAITAIADRTALGESLTPLGAVTPNALLGAPTLTTPAATPTPLAAATTADLAATTTTTTTPLTTPILTTTQAQLTTPTAPAPQQPSPTNSVLFGDSGELIQSYGAVALVTGSQPLVSVFAQPVTPLIPATARVPSIPRVSKVA